MVPKENIPSIFGIASSEKKWRTKPSHLRTHDSRLMRGNPFTASQFSLRSFLLTSLFLGLAAGAVREVAARAGVSRRDKAAGKQGRGSSVSRARDGVRAGRWWCLLSCRSLLTLISFVRSQQLQILPLLY